MSRERFQNLIPVLLVAVTLVGLVLHSAGLLQPVESLFLRATAPLQEGVSGIAAQFGQLAQTVRDLRTLRQRNQELEAENARLLLDNVRLRDLLPRAWWLGVGISFSYLCGHVHRGPVLMQRLGLEWLYRLLQEPGRLARRRQGGLPPVGGEVPP